MGALGWLVYAFPVLDGKVSQLVCVMNFNAENPTLNKTGDAVISQVEVWKYCQPQKITHEHLVN